MCISQLDIQNDHISLLLSSKTLDDEYLLDNLVFTFFSLKFDILQNISVFLILNIYINKIEH